MTKPQVRTRWARRLTLAGSGLLLVGLMCALWFSANAGATYTVGSFMFRGPPELLLNTADPSRPVLERSDRIFEVDAMSARAVSHLLDDRRTIEIQTESGTALLLRTEQFAPSVGGPGGTDHYINVYYPSLGDGLDIYFRLTNDDALVERLRNWQSKQWAARIIASVRVIP